MCPHPPSASWSILEPKSSICGITFWIYFFDYVFYNLLDLFKAILGSILIQKPRQRWTIFIEGLLEAVWSHLGKLLGCLGALLGCLECYPGTTLHHLWHIFKNENICYLSSLGRFLEAILADIGLFRTQKLNPKSLKHNPNSNCARSLGSIVWPFWSPCRGQNEL